MGLKIIVKFFTTSTKEVLHEVFGTSDFDKIFEKYSDETIQRMIEDYVRKLYDNR